MKLNKAQQELKKFSDEAKAQREKYTLHEASNEISRIVQQKSYVRSLCDTQPRENNAYQLGGPMEKPAWSLPNIGYTSMDFFEPGGTEVYASLFLVSAAKSWPSKYDEEGRIDIQQKALDAVARAIVDYESESFFRLVAPACTQNTYEMYAPIAQPNPAANYCSMELINRMATVMRVNGKVLRTIFVSPDDLADIREYSDTKKEEISENFFRETGNLTLTIADHPCEIKIVETNLLGTEGTFNINDQKAECGPFRGDTVENKFNDYQITNGNIVDRNGNLVQKGETQVYGFSEDVTDYIKMPLAQPYTAYWDPELYKRGQTGFYGWQKMGMLCLDSRCMCMGIIDRSKS
jgi:hypothetical protein